MDGAGCLRSDVGRDAAGEGELAEQPAQALGVLGDVGVVLGVAAVEVGVGHQAGTSVARSGDVDGRLTAVLDGPVEVGVEEVQARGGTPVPEQARLDVVAGQGFAQQRVIEQVDLSDRQIVRGPKPAVDPPDHLIAQLAV